MMDDERWEMLGPRAEGLLTYYREITRVLGRDVARSERGRSDKQASYSINWFFDKICPRWGKGFATPRIAAAFLGDESARNELSFSEAPLASFEDAILEPMNARSLNKGQVRAISRALASDVSLILGPPGTGKTETILNLVSCALATREGATVAVIANNGEALKNITEKIDAMRGLDPAVQPKRVALARSFARLGGQWARSAWSRAHADGPSFSCNDPKQGFFPCLREDLGTNGWEPTVRAEEFLARWPFVLSTIHSIMKCFADGERYLYDYVIMDESSQCDVALGIVAMSCARHLVLVGDLEQLAPAVSIDRVRTAEGELGQMGIEVPRGTAYDLVDGDDGMSVLEAARRVLCPLGAPSSFLSEHYRCHPAIIGFSNREIYDGRLVVMSERDGRVPIRVRWFEGSYHEGVEPRGRERMGSKRNLKQVDVFMTEEFPGLLERLRGDDPPSVCVLTPYRGQLRELRRRMVEAAPELGGKMSFLGSGEASLPSLNGMSLTIHEAQGKEFDIVYLLPVEDLSTWEHPWSQGRRLVNVAVTRARNELVLIVSSSLMSERVQTALLGEGLSVDPDDGRDVSVEERLRYVRKLVDYASEVSAPDGYPAGHAEFGFHRSSLTSVFDKVPLIRRRRWLRGVPVLHDDDLPSAPEVALARALLNVNLDSRGLVCECGVPLAALSREVVDGRIREGAFTREEKTVFVYGDGKAARWGSHFDFALMEARSRRLVMAIEVDGNWHRERGRSPDGDLTSEDLAERLERRVRNELLKDELAVDLGARVLRGNDRAVDGWRRGSSVAAFTLLRLPTDGSCSWETNQVAPPRSQRNDLARCFVTIEELIDEQLSCGCVGAPVLAGRLAGMSLTDVAELEGPGGRDPAEGEGMRTTLRPGGRVSSKIERCVRMAIERIDELSRAEGYRENCLCSYAPDFSAGSGGTQEVDYADPLTQALYVRRFTYGYAYEYYLLYRDVLSRLPPKPTLKVVSVGCGVGTDFWALHYARSRNCVWRDAEVEVSYVGIDRIPWEGRISSFDSRHERATYLTTDAGAYLSGDEGHAVLSDADLVIFPKSVAELPENVFNQVVDALGAARSPRLFLAVCPAHAERRREGQGNRAIWLRRELTESRVGRLVERLSERYVVREDVMTGVESDAAPGTSFFGLRGEDSGFAVFCPGSEVLADVRSGLHRLCSRWEGCPLRTPSEYVEGGEGCKADYAPLLSCGYVCYEVYDCRVLGKDVAS